MFMVITWLAWGLRLGAAGLRFRYEVDTLIVRVLPRVLIDSILQVGVMPDSFQKRRVSEGPQRGHDHRASVSEAEAGGAGCDFLHSASL